MCARIFTQSLLKGYKHAKHTTNTPRIKRTHTYTYAPTRALTTQSHAQTQIHKHARTHTHTHTTHTRTHKTHNTQYTHTITDGSTVSTDAPSPTMYSISAMFPLTAARWIGCNEINQKLNWYRCVYNSQKWDSVSDPIVCLFVAIANVI